MIMASVEVTQDCDFKGIRIKEKFKVGQVHARTFRVIYVVLPDK